MQMIRQDIRDYAVSCRVRYDLIISARPFFQDHFPATGHLRNTARHADLLPYVDLIGCASGLLKTDGLCYVLLPFYAVDAFVEPGVGCEAESAAANGYSRL